MSTLRNYPFSGRTARLLSYLLACCLLWMSACKTSDDASAAAAQLTQTAKTLTDYYSALDTVLTETGQLYAVQEAVNPIAKYDSDTKALIADTKAEIKKREAVAKDLTEMAQEFAKLSGKNATKDASDAAGKLSTELATLKQMQGTAGSIELKAMTFALGALTKAIQEKKEREAARQIDAFAGQLASWFEKEEPFCDSIGKNYAQVTKSLTITLLNGKQADASPFLKVALDPYGLTPQLTDPALRDRVIDVLKTQVDEKSTALATSQQKAGEDLDKALKEMSKRIHLVAEDKAMTVRIPPITLANVEKWIAQSQGSPSSSN